MSPRVLLVDDDDMCRRALGNSLVRWGFDVVQADDGSIAIELDQKPFDIVIADLNMRRVGGIEVVRHYKRSYGASVCCVILSGHDDETIYESCYAAGADDVIQKPTSLLELRRRLMDATLALRGSAA